MPIDGFVLSVDGKLKGRYETSKDAMTAASKLKQSDPVTQVAIYDAIARIYTPVEQRRINGSGRVTRENGFA